MGESNTFVSTYTLYRHLQQYCSHPSIYILTSEQVSKSGTSHSPLALLCPPSKKYLKEKNKINRGLPFFF